jgi:hypothetical protein
MEIIAAGAAVFAGGVAGFGLARARQPFWARMAVALVLTALAFLVGSRLGSWAIMQQAGEAVIEQVGSFFVSVLASISWAVIGAGLFLGGMLLGAVLANARRSEEG